MIKRFQSFEHEVADEYKFLKEEMDLDDDEDEFEDEDDLEEEDDDDDFDDYEDGGDRDILSIRSHKEFIEYNMNEKTIRYLLNKCKEFPCIQDTDLAYLNDDNRLHYGNGWYVVWGNKSKKIKFDDEYIPVVMLELIVDVSFGNKVIDRIVYDMIIWSEVDNYISYIDPIRFEDEDDGRLHIPINLESPNRVTMEDFFKMLEVGAFLKK